MVSSVVIRVFAAWTSASVWVETTITDSVTGALAALQTTVAADYNGHGVVNDTLIVVVGERSSMAGRLTSVEAGTGGALNRKTDFLDNARAADTRHADHRHRAWSLCLHVTTSASCGELPPIQQEMRGTRSG